MYALASSSLNRSTTARTEVCSPVYMLLQLLQTKQNSSDSMCKQQRSLASATICMFGGQGLLAWQKSKKITDLKDNGHVNGL